ncbi:glycoside hydrolase [Guyanagaster necrorhizus]|uniref:mannan endo-1,4-beta-mannosidase n=1 Tax=Guyanagaster necrorhizus TaxID=856835 RepID=A0A9P7W1R8_9AGAR|nr:glycoside hydrolase [Guyanagaster necrorhizus MCA 3950]KAG7450435.1 glycoside hydrolase [Guyanagaster necrorhizus MCA 3950]
MLRFLRAFLFPFLLIWWTAFSNAALGPRIPNGFVTTHGRNFVLDDEQFAFIGANSYWLPLLTANEDVEATFQEMENADVKVLRTWGFNAINGSELAGALKSGLTYYQVWNSSEWVLNDGPQGLQRLDNVINTAGKHGIKVILTFTNNWVGYGGCELYINWITGASQTHDVFYSDPRIIASYQRYVKVLVERYKDSPNIFAWELMNEARCLGDLPGGPNCVPTSGLISRWYKQQADFVRSLDPFHMITTGGEGQFNWSKPKYYWYNGSFLSDYNYNGEAGENFDLDLTFDNIDFGTYHMYPQSWYTELDTPGSNFTVKQWGHNWISQHSNAIRQVEKPLVLEEFGVTGIANKTNIYPAWVDLALKTGHSIMPWQWGQLDLIEGNRVIKYTDEILDGASPNDGYAIYKNQTELWDIFKSAAKVQNARSWIME